MITLFRRIRQQLIGEGKARRYMIYAIGEIALVMIGILLALQVNNWNEQRKQQNEIGIILTEVDGALERTLPVFNSINFIANRVDSTLNLVLSEDFNRELADLNPELTTTFLNNEFLSIDFTSFIRSDVFTKVIVRESEFQTTYRDFINYLKLMTETLTSLSKNIEKFREYGIQNEFYVLNEHPYLLLDDEESRIKSIEYALNDPAFKARVVGFKNQFDRLYVDLVWVRANHLKAFTELKLKKDDFSIQQVDSLWSGQGLSRLLTTECKLSDDLSATAPDSQASTSFTAIYNATNMQIKVSYFVNENSVDIALKPGKLIFPLIPQETPFRIEHEDTCQTFQAGIKNGYFIIEQTDAALLPSN